MDIEKILINDISRPMRELLIENISHSPELFDQLFSLCFAKKNKTAWRAAWILSHVYDSAPDFFSNSFEKMISHIPYCAHVGVNRSFLQILSKSNYNSYTVEFINLCFDWMLSPKQAIAVQVYCMRILDNICTYIPEFKQELIACLENIEPSDYSKGFNSSRKNLLKKLYKSQRNNK